MLAVVAAVVVVLGTLLALPLAFGIMMSSGPTDSLGTTNSRLLLVLLVLVLMAIVALVAAVACESRYRSWSARLSTVAIISDGLILATLAAALVTEMVGS